MAVVDFPMQNYPGISEAHSTWSHSFASDRFCLLNYLFRKVKSLLYVRLTHTFFFSFVLFRFDLILLIECSYLIFDFLVEVVFTFLSKVHKQDYWCYDLLSIFISNNNEH